MRDSPSGGVSVRSSHSKLMAENFVYTLQGTQAQVAKDHGMSSDVGNTRCPKPAHSAVATRPSATVPTDGN